MKGRTAFPSRQGGVVLMIALIILVAMTLGGVALVRSVDTSSIIAGNLAFQQSATHAGSAGVEEAIRTFLEPSTPSALWQHDYAKGYAASTLPGDADSTPKGDNPATATAWEKYWNETINNNPVARPVAAKTCVDRVCTLPTDAAGNTVSYTIQRLCRDQGDPILKPTGCSSGLAKDWFSGTGLGVDNKSGVAPTQYYYRVTVRVAGPRNTTSFIQTIVAI
ncbi:MAG: hypothetical protein WCL27_17755 [Betaproteobacteria bacterium]